MVMLLRKRAQGTGFFALIATLALLFVGKMAIASEFPHESTDVSSSNAERALPITSKKTASSEASWRSLAGDTGSYGQAYYEGYGLT